MDHPVATAAQHEQELAALELVQHPVVKAAYAEDSAPPETAEELADELARLAGWLGLETVVVEDRGDLSAALRSCVASRS